CILTDKKNNVWIATTGSGLSIIKNNKRINYTTQNGLSSDYLNVLCQDKKGNVWIGTDGAGITVWNDSAIAQYSTANNLPSNFIYSLYCDTEGTMWIGTFGGGVSMFKNNSFFNFSTKNGLFDDVIFQILEDDFGRMWFTCNRGVFQVRKEDFFSVAENKLRHVVSTSYGKENGMSGTECNGGTHPAGWKAADGTMWFPTTNDIAVVNPKNITINHQPPLVVVEDLLVDNQVVDIADRILIPPGKQRYEFHYTGLSFNGPRKVKFKVKLEGYDNNWDDVGARRAAYYSHLPPGEYTFRVLAANSDGIWNNTGASISFVVQAQFYQTKTFFIFVFVIVLLFVYNLYRFRTRQIRNRHRELEILAAERTKDLSKAQQQTEKLLFESEHQKERAEKANSMKTQLLDITAHDLRNPIITIDGIAKEILETNSVDEKSIHLMEMIRNSTQRMILLISDLLNLSAIESGQLRLKREHVNIAELVALVISGYELQASKKLQRIRLHADPTALYIVNADTSRIQ
ncbi:MAG: hybrid sensor, partial [Stygiobacter sp.]